MDKNTLVMIDIDSGRKIIELLDNSELDTSNAFWYYLTDIEDWRLFIVIKEVDTIGPKKTYLKVQKILKNSQEEINIQLQTISIISPNHQLNRLLKLAINTGPNITGMRFTGNVINGVLIKDAYLYRIN